MKFLHLRKIAVTCIAALVLTVPVSASTLFLQIGSRGTEVRNIQSTLKQLGFFRYHTATGYYGIITENAVKEFQQKQNLDPSGIVDVTTARAIYDRQPQKITSRSHDRSRQGALDWYTDVQHLWPRGSNAMITDVDTGKSFELQRTFGHNHADVEPLTKEDAAIIRDIWGGWSWERRAVIVEIGEYVIAGSMTAMPHAGVDAAPAVQVVNNRSGGYGRGQNLDAVKGNGVDGHMDIHFLNSKTHGTNQVQKAHQDMVHKAARSIAENYR